MSSSAARPAALEPEIVGIGASLYDVVLDAPEYPREDSKLRVDSQSFHCGGPAATGLVAAAKLGARTAFAGVFSDDAYSKAMLDDFARYGVDTSASVLKPGLVAGSAIVVNSRKTSSRTIFWTRGTVPSLSPEEVPHDLIAGARMLYLDGNHIDAAERACKVAAAAGVEILLDAGSPYPGIERILSHCDILIASEEFILALAGERSPEAAAMAAAERFGSKVLVVTQGARGGFYFDEGKAKRYPAFAPPGPIISTNAAGDVFHGAFAAARLRGRELYDCLVFASATSAIKCASENGRQGIPNRSRVEAFVAASELRVPSP
ncbi:MAG: PfkB family carbohydrate kinase [Spirochaetes bacterium]|nr:PfkB family carbohydrate kinase [Spirochaetota bacterium]